MLPAYHFPLADVRLEQLKPDGGAPHAPSRGDRPHVHPHGRRQAGPCAALRDAIDELRELIRLDWDAMDAWFEGDEEVFTHPRDPYTRVDILASSRHVHEDVDGATIAESTSPRPLFGTGLPVC